MSRILSVVLWSCLLLVACERDAWEPAAPVAEQDGALFHLDAADYDGSSTRRSADLRTNYDRVEFRVIDDASGRTVPNLKGLYDPQHSVLCIEGLREGDYRLLVLGMRGDWSQDGVEVHPIGHVDERWVSFPEDLGKPLAAEYFYSQTPFTVRVTTTAAGEVSSVVTGTQTTQQRIIGRADFDFTYTNPYIRTALVSLRATLGGARFRTGMTGGGAFTGQSDELAFETDLEAVASYGFLPTVEGYPLRGEIELVTRTYRGGQVRRLFGFELERLEANRIGRIHTPVVHPDNSSGTMFLTQRAYDEGSHGLILQDGEPKSVYTDPAQRRFNTAAPLQLAVTEAGELHARFYSPRALSGVLVRARIPRVSDEFLDLAWFDSIPPFADFYEQLPQTLRPTVCRSATGRWVEIPQLEAADFEGVEFTIESEDPYWKKLQQILHGWTIAFSLFNGDPDRPDGGPSGNWMGIRPVHCREAVAFFLNFTYMIDMPEHEVILRENQDRLYGNGGVNDKVTPEKVLSQMRQSRNLNVGLVYPGNGIVGLGGGSSYGVYQQAWLQHYFNTYSCEIMFHELGHVMGYSHSSSFTYGPWAQELMNNFYVTHLNEMPIDSPSYLNSSNNPTLY